LLIVPFLISVGSLAQQASPSPPKDLTIRLVTQLGHSGRSVQSIAYSSDGQLLATKAADGTVCLWKASSGKEIRRFAGGPDGIFGSRALLLEEKLLISSEANGARVWEVNTGRELPYVYFPNFAVSTALSSRAGLIAVASWREVSLINLSSDYVVPKSGVNALLVPRSR
jgi:WD40 repeat protein